MKRNIHSNLVCDHNTRRPGPATELLAARGNQRIWGAGHKEQYEQHLQHVADIDKEDTQADTWIRGRQK